MNAHLTPDYHERTKHHPGDAVAPRRVDAGLIPKQYKRYVGLPDVALPPPSRSERSLFDVLAAVDRAPQALHLDDLAAVLHYSAGIVRRTTARGRQVAFRAASCTGALYHIEVYVVCGGLTGLAAGIYHYDVLAGNLRPLRTGDYRRALAAACCDDALAAAAASVVLTSTFWRNAWRYEERAYRHVFWDAGTLLANLLAVAEAHDLRPELRTAFVDEEVNALLGVDARREATVAVVSLGAGDDAPQPPEVAPPSLKTEPLSRAEIEYPLIWQTHAATRLRDCASVQAWRRRGVGASHDSPLRKPRAPVTLEEAIERRGSARRFSSTPLPLDALQAVLAAAQGWRRSDLGFAAELVRPLVIVNRVEGLEAGSYRASDDGSLSPIRPGDFAAGAAHLALDQPAAGSAAVNLYFVASLREVASALGERGYRAVQLEAGVRTGQVYLAAASLGLRATGLTFYDDEVARFFGLEPEETLVLMLVVFGV